MCGYHITEPPDYHSYENNNDDCLKVITLCDLSSGRGCPGFPEKNKWDIFTSQTSQ